MPHETTEIEQKIAPAIESNFDQWQQRLDHLEAELPTTSTPGAMPEWWMNEGGNDWQEIVPQLQEEGADLKNVSRFYEVFARQSQIQAKVTGQEEFNHPLYDVISFLGEDLTGRAFSAEDPNGPLHKAAIEDLSGSAYPATVCTEELDMLKRAFGCNTMTELLAIDGEGYNSELRRVLRKPEVIKWIRFEDEVKDPDNMLASTKAGTRAWMSGALEAATGIPAEEARDYVFSASRNLDGDNEYLLDILNKFDHFGVSRIRDLAQATGIHGLEGYSIEQLERMEAYSNSPTELSKELASHDVNVVMVNRFGDYNGVMRDIAETFDDGRGRTLFFEITTMDDIYRYMSVLHKAGIRPSTVVLGSHSAPGQFMISDERKEDKSPKRTHVAAVAGRKLIEMANADTENTDGYFGYSMHGMKGMARLVETYMQPSRGLDDDSTDIGRKKIIFQACYAASEQEVWDRNHKNERVQIGNDSVVSRLGRDLLANGLTSNVDIYGASDGIQVHKTERGVNYSRSGTVEERRSGLERPHVSAQRIRLQNGELITQEVDDIFISKAA